MKTIIITLMIVLAPLLVTLTGGGVMDYVRHRRQMDPARARRNRMLGKNKREEQQKPSTTGGIMSKLVAGFKDERLVSARFERRDKWGINIKPSPLAISWRRVYLILIVIQAALAWFGASSMAWPMIGVSAIIGFITLGIIVSNGGKCLVARDEIITRMFDTLSGHMHLDKDADPKSLIRVGDWTLPDEPQIIADAKVKARQDGEYKELEKDLPENQKHRPKVAAFRTTPMSMTVEFPVSFRKEGTDDTLAHLNEIFGGKTEWVAERDVPDGKGGMQTQNGWEFENGIVYLRTVPPLPTKAMLPENFNEGPYNVIRLGATVSGEGAWDINVTPMALIPLATDTMLWVEDPDGGWTIRRLDRIRPGDRLLTAQGEPTAVIRLTERHTPDDMYAITFRDYGHEGWKGSLFTTHSAGSHLWPVDASVTNMQILPDNEDELGSGNVENVSSRAIYDLARQGHRVMLKAAHTAARTVRWTSVSATMEKPREVMCLDVDAPDHTFLIACAHDGDTIHVDDADDALAMGIPTHNCGSPLATDTRVPMYDGGEKTMGGMEPGDTVVGSDGGPATVIAVSPVMTPEHLYRLTLEPDDDISHDYAPEEGEQAD